MKIATLKHTCEAAPSQWEGTLEDGRPLYIRYRHGYLCVHEGVDGPEIFGQQIGDRLDGYIELDQVLQLTGLTLDCAVEDALDS